MPIITQQPFKLNDLQNKPLVCLCALLIMGMIYQINKGERMENMCAEERRLRQSQMDSVNREQIILYRDLALAKQHEQNTDSLLRTRTQTQVDDILNGKKHK